MSLGHGTALSRGNEPKGAGTSALTRESPALTGGQLHEWMPLPGKRTTFLPLWWWVHAAHGAAPVPDIASAQSVGQAAAPHPVSIARSAAELAVLQQALGGACHFCV